MSMPPNQHNRPAGVSFDLVAATRAGYAYLWHERSFIVRLAAIPVFVKFICYAAILTLGLESNVLRQGLILFPAYLLEGYLVCTLLRMGVFTNEALIQPPGAKSYEYYRQRGRDIQAGAIIYTLLKLFASFFIGAMSMLSAGRQTPSSAGSVDGALDSAPASPPVITIEAPNGSFEQFFAGVLVFIFAIWAFRLVWLYVPVTLGYTMRDYMRKVKGASFSFHIFAVWVMCMLPAGLCVLFLSDTFAAVTGHSAEAPSHLFRFVMVGVQAVFETAVVIISSIAIGVGVFTILSGRSIVPEKKDR